MKQFILGDKKIEKKEYINIYMVEVYRNDILWMFTSLGKATNSPRYGTTSHIQRVFL